MFVCPSSSIFGKLWNCSELHIYIDRYSQQGVNQKKDKTIIHHRNAVKLKDSKHKKAQFLLWFLDEQLQLWPEQDKSPEVESKEIASVWKMKLQDD